MEVLILTMTHTDTNTDTGVEVRNLVFKYSTDSYVSSVSWKSLSLLSTNGKVLLIVVAVVIVVVLVAVTIYS